MAPVPRCELRLPAESGGRRTEITTPKPIKLSKYNKSGVGSGSEIITGTNSGHGSSPGNDEKCPAEEDSKIPQAAHDKIQRDSAQILEAPRGKGKDKIVKNEDYQNVPEPAHSDKHRDSAQILEDAPEFSTSLTRDMAEIREHKISEGGKDECAGMNPCEILAKCRAEADAAEAKGEFQTMKCPSLSDFGTPGDVCAKFCHDRHSPFPEGGKEKKKSKHKFCEKWGKDPNKVRSCKGVKIKSKGADERRGPVVCLGTYKSAETYTTFWGSSKAIDLRKKMERQMKKKRQILEKKHEKEYIRRQKMRKRAKEKRKALKQRDQSKIPESEDQLRINKAYDLRFNFNKQLPSMPMTMKLHFDKYKKPPFKHFITGKVKKCNKEIDEFEKLRVPVEKK